MSQNLNKYQGAKSEFYFRKGQVISLNGLLFQHQTRYKDGFGINFIGHFMIDESGFESKMPDDSLSSFRNACDALVAHNAAQRAKT